MSVKLEYLGDDRYRTRVGVGRDPITGRYRQRSVTFRAPTRKAAKEQHAANELRLRREAKAQRRAAGTVGWFTEKWMGTMRAEHKSPTTIKRDESIVRAIIAGLGSIPLEQLSVADVEQWYTRLRSENVSQAAHKGEVRFRSESTVHHFHRILHQILTTAERHGHIDVAPTRRARPPKRAKPRPRPPETDVVRDLITSAPDYLGVAATLAATLGLRRGEIIGLRWSDLGDGRLVVERSVADVHGQPPIVKSTKTEESNRVLQLPASTATILAAWRQVVAGRAGELGAKLSDRAFVFPELDSTRGGRADGSVPMRPSHLGSAWRRHARGTGVRFHDLRHWSATQLLALGRPLPEVAAFHGHSRTSTTLDVYAKAVPMAGELAPAALLAAQLTEPAELPAL